MRAFKNGGDCMNNGQIHLMMEISRENGNFRELRRLHKILQFQDPDFKYPPRRGNKILPRAFKRWKLVPKNS